MKNDDQASTHPTRRIAMATGAAISAGLAMTSPLMAAVGSSSEIEAWESFKGKEFLAVGPSTSSRSTRSRLVLAGVEAPETRDRKLPRECRDPFLLVFIPVQGGVLEQGEYQFTSPDGDRLSLFINESMARNHGGQPMMQAAFN